MLTDVLDGTARWYRGYHSAMMALIADEIVEQGAFAYIRLADDGDGDSGFECIAHLNDDAGDDAPTWPREATSWSFCGRRNRPLTEIHFKFQ